MSDAPIPIDEARRRPPSAPGIHSGAGEAELVGMLLLPGPKAAAAVGEVVAVGLAPEHFFTARLGQVYGAVVKMIADGRTPSELALLAAELPELPEAAEIAAELVVLASPTFSAATEFAEMIMARSARRRQAAALAALHDALQRGGHDEQRRAWEALDQARQAGASIAAGGPIHAAVRAAAARCRLDGATFILDAAGGVPPVWGQGDQVAWAGGEPFFICGPAGVGKTTIAQQLALARLGLGSEVLGLPVAPDERRVVYMAADRPPQAARSLARMVTEEDRELLAERLVIWRGPLPFNMVKEPEGLAAMCQELDAGTAIIDSLKDVAAGLSEDESGSAVNRALQLACLDGVEVVALHHQRKRAQMAVKPRALEDVYGSTWLTAGAGSVVLLWGEAGDPVVELTHLKQPAEDIGPIRVLHDHAAGRSTVVDQLDLLAVMVTLNGLTAQEGARRIFDTDKPTRNEVEKARRRLDGMVRSGVAFRREGQRGGGADRTPARWYAGTLRSAPDSTGSEAR